MYVEYRTPLGLVGTVLKFLSLAPVVPAAVALYYGESPVPFVVTIGVMAGLGVALERLRTGGEIGHREAFLLVALTWLAIPVLGAIPYLVAGEGTVAHPINALFESMSGFTTTGATVLGEISFDRHSRSILLWRQLTQWLGGMGILVLMVAILPELSVGGAQVVNEEAPGFALEKHHAPHPGHRPRPVDDLRRLHRRRRGGVLRAALAGMAPNMDLYNAVAHALTTLPTGGFSPEARSVEAFSPAVQWAVVLFMVVAGTNFALLWYAATGEPGRLVRNDEFRSYLLAMGVVAALLTVLLFTGLGLAEVPANVDPLPGDPENSVRQATFQTMAIVTTTGYASMDFNAWGESSKVVLLLAMFLGGSAGSAAGSIKIVRWLLVRRAMARELYVTIHPEAIRPIRFTGEPIEEETLRGVFILVLSFLALFAASSVVLFLDALRTGLELSAIEAVSASIATLGNIGPGVGIVGPMNSFLPFSRASKLYMVFLMWLGRLEVLSVLIILSPAYWRQ